MVVSSTSITIVFSSLILLFDISGPSSCLSRLMTSLRKIRTIFSIIGSNSSGSLNPNLIIKKKKIKIRLLLVLDDKF